LGLVLYDRSERGTSPQESKALYDSLMQNKEDLELSQSDLEERLVIVNPGLEKDTSMRLGGRLIVLPGITQAYTHEVLEKVEKDLKFKDYGLQGGLPLIEQLDNQTFLTRLRRGLPFIKPLDDGDRTLLVPNDEAQDIRGSRGLRVLVRYGDSSLGIWNHGLDGMNTFSAWVTFVPQGASS